MKTIAYIICLLALSTQLSAQKLGLGKLDFPNSGSAAAQPAFIKGMLLLHSFEFDDAGEAFREAQKIDPEFALAYWGEAMSFNHPLWFRQNKEEALAALKRLSPVKETRIARAKLPVEKDLIRAIHVLYGEGEKEANDLRYADFMKGLYEKYPDHLEIISFYGLALMGTSHDGRDYDTYQKAGEIISKVYASNPEHPGALHYYIHAYDDPYSAPKALEAAKRYSKVAPEASHALHMPTHIFVAMGMWDEVVAGNIDSWQASESRRLRKDLTLQDRGYHAFHWLEYGLLQQNKIDQARTLLDSMVADTKILPSTRLRSHLAMMQAGFLVESERWKSEAFDIEVDYTLLGKGVRASNKFAKGMAAIKKGDVEYARNMLKEMIEERILEEPLRVDEDMTVCHSVGGKYFDELELDSKVAAIMESELEALILMTENRTDEAYALLDQATAAESQLPLAYGPPDIVKPSHELYGEILLLNGNPSKAAEMFEEALKRAPNRRLAVRGLQMSQTMVKDSE